MTRPCDALLQVMERERADLLAGRLGQLPAHAERKQTLGAALALAAPAADRMQLIRDHAARNAALLAAACDGVLAAKLRLEACRAGLRSAVYRPDGTAIPMADQHTRLERKA